MHTKILKDRAIVLRKGGNSLAYISDKLKVAKSTLSLWLKGVSFVPNALLLDSNSRGQKKISIIKRADKLQSIQAARIFASSKLRNISSMDDFFVGLGIYIGEGSKTANFVRVVNSDSRIVRFMYVWLMRFFDVKEENVKVRIHIYPDLNEEAVIKHWMRELVLPKTCFHTCYVDYRTNKKRENAGLLACGTAHMSVINNGRKDLGVLLHRKILATIDQVLNRGIS